MTSLNGQRDTGDRSAGAGQEGAMLQKPEHSLQFKALGAKGHTLGHPFLNLQISLPALIFVGISQRM